VSPVQQANHTNAML